MPRDTAFVFRVNAEERRMITALAQQLRRSESDALRQLIRGAVQQLEVKPAKTGDATNAPRK